MSCSMCVTYVVVVRAVVKLACMSLVNSDVSTSSLSKAHNALLFWILPIMNILNILLMPYLSK